MGTERDYKKILQIALLCFGLGLLCVAFYFVWVTYYNPYIRIPFYRRGNYMLTIMYGAILALCVISMKGHKIGESFLREVVLSQSISTVMTAIIVYFPMSLLQYGLLNPLPLLMLVVLQTVIIVVWNLAANRIFFRIVPPLQLLMIADRGDKSGLADKLNGIPHRYRILDTVYAEEGAAQIKNHLKRFDAVLLTSENDALRSWVIDECFKENIQLLMRPTLSEIVVNGAAKAHPVDTVLLNSIDHRLTIDERVIKRIFDIVVSLLAIIITSPIMLVTAIAVKLYDGGPVFFRQERLTRDGQRFELWKFRSMIVDAERQGQKWAEEEDKRITPVGKVIRKFRVDELPQFFNVLIGDMAVVGPRPEVPALADEFTMATPEFSYRLRVKAGITGYAQVYGSYATDPIDKLRLDLLYIENYSILMDLNLMLMTARALVMTEKTKGLVKNDETENEKDAA